MAIWRPTPGVVSALSRGVGFGIAKRLRSGFLRADLSHWLLRSVGSLTPTEQAHLIEHGQQVWTAARDWQDRYRDREGFLEQIPVNQFLSSERLSGGRIFSEWIVDWEIPGAGMRGEWNVRIPMVDVFGPDEVEGLLSDTLSGQLVDSVPGSLADDLEFTIVVGGFSPIGFERRY